MPSGNKKINLALFCSGSGTNAQKIIDFYKGNEKVSVQLILSNNKNAYALERATQAGIKTQTFTRDEFYNTDKVSKDLGKENIDWIILAGFLWLIPSYLVKSYPNKIINIHPALLPKYGGKGMYGMHVHESVVAAKEEETGISIHYVNEKYDEGNIIFQARCSVDKNDTPESVALKVQSLEHLYFPKIINQLIDAS